MRVVLAALLVLLVAAGPASAVGTLATQDLRRAIDGPLFAGDRVVWATDTPRGGGIDIHSAAPDGSAHERWNIAGPTGHLGLYDYFGLGASAERLAAGLNIYGCGFSCKSQIDEQRYNELLSAPLGQMPEELGPGPCAFGRYFPEIDISGNAVAYSCGSARVTVRDFSPPAGAPESYEFLDGSPALPGGSAPRIAGAHLVVREGTVLVMRRWRDGAEELRFETLGNYDSFDVQPDGKMAFTAPHEGGRWVMWASPSSPEPTPIAPIGSAGRVRIASDLVAIGGGQSAEVRRLDGSVVAASPKAALGDFDGARLTWAAKPCAVLAIATWDLEGEPPAMPDGVCPLGALRSPTLRTVSNEFGLVQAVAVELTCRPQPALGCAGGLKLHGRDGRKPPLHSVVDYAYGEYRLAPGETGTFVMPYGKRRICIGGRYGLRPVLDIGGIARPELDIGGIARPEPRLKRRRVSVPGLAKVIRRCGT
jgi:hypothetical protein